MAQRLVLTGANGFVGRHVIQAAVAERWDVAGVVRNDAAARVVSSAGGRPVRASGLAVAELTAAFEGASAVVHLAQIGSERPGVTYADVNVAGTRHVAEAARAAGVGRVVYFSGLGIAHYGQWPRCTNPYFLSKLEAEAALFASPLEVVVFRPSYIIGPGDSWAPFVLKQMAAGELERVGDGLYRMQPIAVKDVARLVVAAAAGAAPPHRVFDLVGPEPISCQAFYERLGAVARRLGKVGDWRIREVPVAEADRAALSEGGYRGMAKDELDCLLCDEIGDARPLEALLGGFLTPLDDAIAAAVRSVWRVRLLERGLLASLLGASLAALVFVVSNGLAPTPTRLSLGLALWAGFLALYASVALPGVAVLALLGRSERLGPSLAWLLRVACAGFLAMALWRNRDALAGLAALPGGERFRLLGPAALVLCALGLALAALFPLGRKTALRVVTAAALLATLGAFYPLRPGPSPVFPPVRATPPLVVVGLDGADWRYIEPLLARHELPNLAALRAAGAWGPLATLKPTLSPVVWTTMATGRLPADHGVDGFLMTTLRPVDVALPSTLRVPEGVGARSLIERLRARELWRESPVGSEARRVPALWNLATAYGSPMVVVHWWATSNPEPVQGALISARPYYAVTEGASDDEAAGAVFPSRLYPELLSRVVKPTGIPFSQARGFVGVTEADWSSLVKLPLRRDGHLLQMLPYTLSLHETTRRLTLYALERTRTESGRAVDLMVLFRLVDMVCHKGLVDSDLIARAPGEQDTIFTPAVAEAYRTVDRVLGELVAAVPGANVVVVSDHGFDVIEGRRGRRAHHERAPDGIFVAAGPAFRPGRAEGLSVLDVMPLLLNLKGMAQARNLAGRLPDGVLAPDWLALRVPEPIDSYDGVKRGARASVRGGAQADRGELEGLRALGYVN